MLTGNLLSIGIGGIITIGWSLIRPANFDWDITRAINQKAGEPGTTIVDNAAEAEAENASPDSSESLGGDGDKKNYNQQTVGASAVQTPREGKETSVDVDTFNAALEARRSEEEKDMEGLRKAFRFAAVAALSLTFILIIAIPLPLFFSSHGQSPLLLNLC